MSTLDPSTQRNDPGALSSAEIDRAHVTPFAQDTRQDRAEILERYAEPKSDATVPPPGAETLAAEQSQDVPEEKCPCGNKQLSPRVQKAVEAFLKGGPLTADIAHLITSKNVADIRKELTEMVSGGAEVTAGGKPGFGSGTPQLRRGDAMLTPYCRQYSADRFQLQGNGLGKMKGGGGGR
jgi:hypothetical protein